MHNAEHAANIVCFWHIHHDAYRTKTRQYSLQFSKGFEKKEVPSGKGYIRLTPQPNA